MRDLLSKLDAIVSETSLKNPEDLAAKRKALQDLQTDPVASTDPSIKQAIIQRKADLEKEAKAKGFSEEFEIGDEFGISFSEDFEVGAEIVGFVEDGIVIELDDTALNHLQENGIHLIDGELSEALDEARGPCWVGYKQVGMKKKGGKQVPNCVKEDEQTDESGLQYYTGKKKYGKDGMAALAQAGRDGASEEELGRIKDKYKKEDHGPENPEADYNKGEYDREGDMAKDDLRTLNDAAKELYSIIQADENLPEWVQAKINRAMDYLDTARDYMKANKYAEDTEVGEAKYQGKEVPLGKKLPGDVKKSKVYVRKPNGKIVKVNFGDKKMRIKKSNPARRKSFRARHNCKNPGPRWKARYWSCRSW